MLRRKAIIDFAIIGAIASAVCCITPVGGWLLQAIGLSGWISSLPQVMLPLMSLFIGLGTGTAYFRIRDRRRK